MFLLQTQGNFYAMLFASLVLLVPCASLKLFPLDALDDPGNLDDGSFSIDSEDAIIDVDGATAFPFEKTGIDVNASKNPTDEKTSSAMMWLHISRNDYLFGLKLYYPLVTSLGEGFSDLGMTVMVTNVRNNTLLITEIENNPRKQHWVVSLGYRLAKKNTVDTLRKASALGARIVLYQTEPNLNILKDVPRWVQRTAATEVWDYSHRNLALYSTQAVKRYMPPGYVQALDFNVDEYDSGSEGAPTRISFLGSWKRRPAHIARKYEQILGSALEVTSGVWTPEQFRNYLASYPLQLNTHFSQSDSFTRHSEPLESLRMALLLSNKACVLSAPVDPADRTPWESMVLFVEIEDTMTVLKRTQKDLQSCRQQGYSFFKNNFTMAQIIANSGILNVVK